MISPIFVALDNFMPEEAFQLAETLNPEQCGLKIGKELFTRGGPHLVKAIMDQGFQVFLDLKFHDIPNTVAKACVAAADLGVFMINVHCSGGPKMLTAAREALDNRGGKRPLLIGVTVLTSMNESDLQAIGFENTQPKALVRHLAGLAKQAGLDGVVCSPQESKDLKATFGEDFCLVTPGVRPAGANQDDQARSMTPQEALTAGSDYLVIGRPITQATDPAKALQNILLDIHGVSAE